MTFLGPLLITLIVGGIFFCCVQALVEYIKQFHREPVIDELDYDNAHPDGWVGHFAADKREVRR